jgi:hypothetical protein
MMRRILFIIQTIISTGCITVPEPTSEVSIRKIEIERSPHFNKVLVLPLTGTTDSEGKASNIVQQEVMHILGSGTTTVSSLQPIFNAAEAIELMPLALQPQMLWFENLLRKNSPKGLLAGAIHRFPGLEFGVRLEKDPTATLKTLAKHAKTLEKLSDSLLQHDKQLFEELLKPQTEVQYSLTKLQYWAEVQYQPTWLLAFYLSGSKEDWESGKTITLKSLALNFETGGLRFATSASYDKASLQASFETALVTLTNYNLKLATARLATY